MEENIQGVCKNCGNGTLNNELNPAFHLVEFGENEEYTLICNRCGSPHVDVVVS